jgi:hypothetical protein
MSAETKALMRSILYQAETAETVEDIRGAVRVMCSKEIIEAVDEQLKAFYAERAAAKKTDLTR